MSFDDSGLFNPEGNAWLNNYYSKFNSQFNINYEGGGIDYLGADWDRWISYVRNGGKGAIEEFYGGKKTVLISLGFGLPTLQLNIKLNPSGYTDGAKVEITIRVFGSEYSKYNFVQSVYQNFDDKCSFKYEPDPIWEHNYGFYYTENELNDYSKPYHRKGSDGFFRDSPNPGNGFHAEWTLCGLQGESWYAISTFSWGYSIISGQVSPYFQNSSNVIEEHQKNVINSINYHNSHP